MSPTVGRLTLYWYEKTRAIVVIPCLVSGKGETPKTGADCIAHCATPFAIDDSTLADRAHIIATHACAVVKACWLFYDSHIRLP
jgi:hypothetical protein